MKVGAFQPKVDAHEDNLLVRVVSALVYRAGHWGGGAAKGRP